MARVVFDQVWKRFGHVVAVKNLNLHCQDREFVAVLGPSGCGKTSSLRMAAGLEIVSEGSIYIGDRVVNDLPPKSRDIAMVFENYALYPPMVVYDNIAFPLQVRGLSKAEIDKRVKGVAEMMGITELLRRKPSQLSGGQRQRVALGRAIVRDPAVFLMDEPLANLDAQLRQRMRGELKHLFSELESTVIYVTHDQIEAMAMADRIAVMNQGVLQQVGTPQEIFNHPSNEFVAGFVGSPPMNFVDGRIVAEGDRLFFYTEDRRLRVPLPPGRVADLKVPDHRKVRVGVRPNDIFVHAAEPMAGWYGASQVLVVEPTGEEALLTVEVGGCKIEALTPGYSPFSAGQQVWLTFNEKVHLFDPETGEALG